MQETRNLQNYKHELEKNFNQLKHELYSIKKTTGHIEKSEFIKNGIVTKNQLQQVLENNPTFFVKCVEASKNQLPIDLFGDYTVTGSTIFKDGNMATNREIDNIIDWACSFPHYPLSTSDLGITISKNNLQSIDIEKFNGAMRLPTLLNSVKIVAGFSLDSKDTVTIHGDFETGAYQLKCGEEVSPLDFELLLNLDKEIRVNALGEISSIDSLGMLNGLLANDKVREAICDNKNLDAGSHISFIRDENKALALRVKSLNDEVQVIDINDEDFGKIMETLNEKNSILTKMSLYSLAKQLLNGTKIDNTNWDLQSWQSFCENATILIQNAPRGVMTDFGTQIAQNFFRFEPLYNNGITGINLIGSNGNTKKIPLNEFNNKIQQVCLNVITPLETISKALNIQPTQFAMGDAEIAIEQSKRKAEDIERQYKIHLPQQNNKLLFSNLYRQCELAIEEYPNDLEQAVESVVGVVESFKDDLFKNYTRIQVGKTYAATQINANRDIERTKLDARLRDNIEEFKSSQEYHAQKNEIRKAAEALIKKDREQLLKSVHEAIMK